jgi:hypothetical protein
MTANNMGSTESQAISGSKRALAMYNMVPNLVWSLLNLTPISVYGYTTLDPRWFCTFLAVSLVPIFLKNSILDKLQIAHSPGTYKRLGVHWVNKVAQGGDIINGLVRRKYPEHKIVTRSRSSITGLVRQTYIFEKFHWILFLYFSFTTVYALTKGHWGWTFGITLNNIAYNVYPNFLQQYVRLKLRALRGRGV